MITCMRIIRKWCDLLLVFVDVVHLLLLLSVSVTASATVCTVSVAERVMPENRD